MEKMRTIVLIVVFLLVSTPTCYSQSNKRILEVYSITEYVDGFLIRAFDSTKNDTINIISIKDSISKRRHFQRIKVGKKYLFEYEDLILKLASVPSNSHVAKIKTTVIWKKDDGVKNRPFYAVNTKGLWIKQ